MLPGLSTALAILGTMISAAGDDDQFDPAVHIIENAVIAGDVPGAAVLIMKNGAVVVESAFGTRDTESGRPFETDTICWIASLTKPVTAAAAMTLVEKGRLGLDDPVEKYLPEFRKATGSNVAGRISCSGWLRAV